MTPKTTAQKFQRGFHVELSSPPRGEMEFLTAFCIQSREEDPGAFHAVRIDEKTLELRTGGETCRVTIADDGQLNYTLK